MNVAWYATRAAGMVAFLGLTTSVLVGLLLAGRARLPNWPRFAVEDVHLFAGALTWTFVAAHMVTLLIDDYIGFSLVDLLVPAAAGYMRIATAIGVLAFWLLLAIGVGNRLRRSLPYATWRRIHQLNFAVWLLALVHGIFGGSDTNTVWGTTTYAVATAAVAGAAAWRVLQPRRVEQWALLLWPATAAVVSCELVVALALVG